MAGHKSPEDIEQWLKSYSTPKIVLSPGMKSPLEPGHYYGTQKELPDGTFEFTVEGKGKQPPKE